MKTFAYAVSIVSYGALVFLLIWAAKIWSVYGPPPVPIAIIGVVELAVIFAVGTAMLKLAREEN